VNVRRLLLTGVLVVGALSGFVQGGTIAYFTSSATSAGNQFTAGTVNLAAGVATGDTLTVSNLVPGDSFSARLTIHNGGNLDLRYAMTTSTTGSSALASALQLTIRTKTTNPCSSLDGAVLYGPGNLNVAGIGNPAQGPQAGDRTLAAGTSEDLCFAVSLPGSAPTSLQGTSTSATFTFASEQL